MIRTTITRLLGDERVRFLIVGGINTVLGYGLFVLFELTFGKNIADAFGDTVGYLCSLYLSYVIAIAVAFILHRRFTFKVAGTGNVFLDFARFASVYVVSLVINSFALPLLVEFGHLSPLVGQAIVVVITTLISYFGHKWFSFRRAPEPMP
ncbi:GtrA family protein [Glaciihabitans sp. dw_435]|uniref:GtrA family protein n=1 Tax=Glaciihabitans sp. dw_435 TaxID=2720081 RepID=UPI001BD35CFB|nr:GtrA family protein [Glaciihabitans sp. dw_435]